MMSVGAMGGGQGGYYVGLAREDYYMEGGEPPGVWFGTGAERLGLTENGGLVERESFLRLFQGMDPNGSGPGLVQNAGEAGRQPGWDLTFSAPKSVSALWACADPELRAAIQAAHFAAVKEACQYLEDTAGITRRGHDGLIREKAHLLFATFEHGTSRAQDPQLHTHALVLNLGVREDGTIGTILSKPFYEAKMAAGALYRAELAYQMELLEFRMERTGPKGATCEVVGVPRKLCDTLSTRRQEIKTVLETRGEEGARASAMAALDTRQVKEHIARDTLVAGWKVVGQEHGLTPQSIEALRQRGPETDREADKRTETERLRDSVKEVVAAATKRITEDKSHFSERDLLRTVAEEAAGKGLWASLVRTATTHALEESQKDGTLVLLGEVKGEKRYTTRELLETEKQLLRAVDELRGGKRFGVEEKTLVSAVRSVEEAETKKAQAEDPTAEQRTLNAEQLAALKHIVQGEGQIAVVSGIAGSGKTFLLQAAREAWEQSGYTVIGAAVPGKAARGLQEGAGIESGTLAKLLLNEQQGRGRLDAKTVLVVDEAGMVGTRQMAALAAAVEEAGAKLVLTGESRQLQPVEIGGPFRVIEERIGRATLTSIVRQALDKNDTNPYWRREAVAAFADGRAAEALAAFRDRGFLNIAENREGAMQELISAWRAALDKQGNRGLRDNLIFSGTRAETRELNRMAQAARREEGGLGFRSVRVNGEIIHEKDRILITKNDARLGVSNGDLGTVKRIEASAQRMTVRMDDGREASLAYPDLENLTLGYAITTHKGQGVTVKNSFVLCGGVMADREITYVQASRARKDTHFFTERITLWDTQREARVERTFEELSRRMSHSSQKDMAHSLIPDKLNLQAEHTARSYQSKPDYDR